jgi:hypothetical protein
MTWRDVPAGGQDEDARQLALAKLRFLLRRVQHCASR